MDLGSLPFALSAIALVACATPKELPGCRNHECIALGERQVLMTGVAVTPLSVVEDSRCAIEVDCVWAGRVLVQTQIELKHEVVTVALDSSGRLHINAGMLSIAEIAPDKSINWQIEPENYRFAFTFVPDIMESPKTGN